MEVADHDRIDMRSGQAAVSFAEQASSRYRAVLVKFFTRKLKDPSEAEDYAQEVLARLIASEQRGIKNLDAYVFQIAGNLARDLYRRTAVRERYLRDCARQPDLGVEQINPEQIVGDRRQLDALIARIEALPQPTQRIFVLCKFEHMTINAVAERFNISPSTVKNHLSRALVRLTSVMEFDDA